MQVRWWRRHFPLNVYWEQIPFVSQFPQEKNRRLSVTWQLLPPQMANWKFFKEKMEWLLLDGYKIKMEMFQPILMSSKPAGLCCHWEVIKNTAVIKDIFLDLLSI